MKHQGLLKITILFSAVFAVVQISAVAPLIASILGDYPELLPSVDWVLSSAAVTMAIFAFLSGLLERVINKKWLLVIGTIFFTIGGMMLIVANSGKMVIASRLILGAGGGLGLPIVPSLMTHLWDGKERAQMMGWQNAMGCLIGLIGSTLAGFLALSNWHAAGWMFVIFIPIIILQIALIPKIESDKKVAAEKSGGQKEKIGGAAWLTLIMLFVHLLLILQITFTMSLFIEGEGLGTSASTGLLNSMQSVVAFLIGLVFASIYRKAGRHTLTLAFALLGAAFIVFSLSNSVFIFGIGMFLYGLGAGLTNPFFMSTVSVAAPPSRVTQIMSYFIFLMLGAQIIAPFYRAFITSFGLDVRGEFVVDGVILLILAVATGIFMTIKKDAMVNKYMIRFDGPPAPPEDTTEAAEAPEIEQV